MNEFPLKSNEHFLQHQKLIQKWAHIYVNAYLGDFDDMIQEASMVYLKACNKYNPKRGKFTTLLFAMLRNTFFDMLRVKKKQFDTLSLDESKNQVILLTLPNNDYYFDGEIMTFLYRGLTVSQIAKELNVDRSTVYRRLEKERDNYAG
jgi:DNA-directed RNA polymerase specialized sigma24 family protein